MNGFFCSFATCVAALESAPTTREIGPWSMVCDRADCTLAQALADESDPAHVWTKLLVRREQRSLRLILVTPPMARPEIRTKLDDAPIALVKPDGCDQEKCTFSGVLKGTALVNIKTSRTLSVLTHLDHAEPGSFDFELDDLAAALERLPMEI